MNSRGKIMRFLFASQKKMEFTYERKYTYGNGIYTNAPYTGTDPQ